MLRKLKSSWHRWVSHDLSPRLMFSDLIVRSVEHYQRAAVWTSHTVPHRCYFEAFLFFVCLLMRAGFFFSLICVVKNARCQQHFLCVWMLYWPTLLPPPHMTCTWVFGLSSHQASRNSSQLKKEVALTLFPNEQTSSVHVSHGGCWTSRWIMYVAVWPVDVVYTCSPYKQYPVSQAVSKDSLSSGIQYGHLLIL